MWFRCAAYLAYTNSVLFDVAIVSQMKSYYPDVPVAVGSLSLSDCMLVCLHLHLLQCAIKLYSNDNGSGSGTMSIQRIAFIWVKN